MKMGAIVGVKFKTTLTNRVKHGLDRTIAQDLVPHGGRIGTVPLGYDNLVPIAVRVAVQPAYIRPLNTAPAEVLAVNKRDDLIGGVRDSRADVAIDHQHDRLSRVQVVINEDRGREVVLHCGVVGFCPDVREVDLGSFDALTRLSFDFCSVDLHVASFFKSCTCC